MSGFKRHRRSGASVATFTVFEADLLRSLAGQLIELLRNESATATQDSGEPHSHQPAQPSDATPTTVCATRAHGRLAAGRPAPRRQHPRQGRDRDARGL